MGDQTPSRRTERCRIFRFNSRPDRAVEAHHAALAATDALVVELDAAVLVVGRVEDLGEQQDPGAVLTQEHEAVALDLELAPVVERAVEGHRDRAEEAVAVGANPSGALAGL